MDTINPILASEIQQLAKFYSKSTDYTAQIYEHVIFFTFANKTTAILERKDNTTIVVAHNKAGVYVYDWIDNKFIKRAIQQL